MKRFFVIAGLVGGILAATFGTVGATSDPYWQFAGKWLCISNNGSTVGYTFAEVADSDWLSQSTVFNNGESHLWVQNFIRRDPNTGNWVAINFQSVGITFQGRSSGFDSNGALTLTGTVQGLDGTDAQARETFSFQKDDGKLAHDWQILGKDGAWKTISSTTCSRTK